MDLPRDVQFEEAIMADFDTSFEANFSCKGITKKVMAGVEVMIMKAMDHKMMFPTAYEFVEILFFQLNDEYDFNDWKPLIKSFIRECHIL